MFIMPNLTPAELEVLLAEAKKLRDEAKQREEPVLAAAFDAAVVQLYREKNKQPRSLVSDQLGKGRATS